MLCIVHTASSATTPLCRRQVMSTTKRHDDRTASNVDRQQCGSVTADDNKMRAAAACTRIGRLFQRRVNATAGLNCDPLTSSDHLRAGQYYRWNPDISNVPAVSQATVDVRAAPCKSAESAASSPWQHKAFIHSDGNITTTESHDVTCPSLQRPVSANQNVLTLLLICPPIAITQLIYWLNIFLICLFSRMFHAVSFCFWCLEFNLHICIRVCM